MAEYPHDFQAIFHKQKEFFESGKSQDLTLRHESLAQLSQELEKRTDEALEALEADLGKPALEAWLAEIHFLRCELRHCLKNLKRWQRPRRAANPFYFWPARSEIRRQPFGRVLIASPWNYPLQLSLSPLISAIASGNCVILKPSECAPATSAFVSDLIASVFDPGHATVITGGSATGEALLTLPFEFFCYTGGEKVGRLYAEAGARHLSPVLLELGGKCPCLIDHDVDLEKAAERIIAGKFFNAGQTCIAPDFVVLPSELHDTFLQLCEEEIRRLYGVTSDRDLAKIVNKRHYHRLQNLTTSDTISIGPDDQGKLSLAPRLLPNTQWDSPVMQEEIFGPLLPVLPCANLAQALHHLKNMPSPLALYIFSNNRGESEHIASSLPSGSVCFNDVMKTGTNHLLPIGGLGKSGLGRYRGRSGFEQFSHERSFTRRWLTRDPFAVKPPYRNKLGRLRKFLRP